MVGIIWLQFSPTLQSLSDKTFFLLFPIKPNCDIEILEVQATNQWIKTTFFPFVFENSFPNQSPFFYIFVFYLYTYICISCTLCWFFHFCLTGTTDSNSLPGRWSVDHRIDGKERAPLYQSNHYTIAPSFYKTWTCINWTNIKQYMVYESNFFLIVLNFLSTLGNYIFPNQFDSSTLSLTKKRIVKDRLKVKD